VFLRPEVEAVSELIPREVLLIPVAVRLNEQHPTEVFPEVLSVVPLIVPKVVGVATGGERVPQHTEFEPVLSRAWPTVPQELAQSIIPAPGLIALVEVPVSQF
jgi:hypothetical protein